MLPYIKRKRNQNQTWEQRFVLAFTLACLVSMHHCSLSKLIKTLSSQPANNVILYAITLIIRSVIICMQSEGSLLFMYLTQVRFVSVLFELYLALYMQISKYSTLVINTNFDLVWYNQFFLNIEEWNLICRIVFTLFYMNGRVKKFIQGGFRKDCYDFLRKI